MGYTIYKVVQEFFHRSTFLWLQAMPFTRNSSLGKADSGCGLFMFVQPYSKKDTKNKQRYKRVERDDVESASKQINAWIYAVCVYIYIYILWFLISSLGVAIEWKNWWNCPSSSKVWQFFVDQCGPWNFTWDTLLVWMLAVSQKVALGIQDCHDQSCRTCRMQAFMGQDRSWN